jgi:hypothetical protein
VGRAIITVSFSYPHILLLRFGGGRSNTIRHIVKSGLTWGRHHSKSRLTSISEIDSLNLVLTTYHTVAAEWKNGNQAEKSTLFSTRWKRVILDEGRCHSSRRHLAFRLTDTAHVIRNSGSQMAKAICSLSAASRWAVTGTPIQNRLGDLVALLKFLQVDPYDDTRRFDADITHLWKTGEAEEAVKRLKRLSGCLLLRRPKETINLPPRRDLRCVVEFCADERALYDEIRSRTIANFKETSLQGGDTSSSITFVNVIQQINSLRLICNMGLQYHSRYDDPAAEVDSQGQSNWTEVAQQAFNFECEAGSITCQLCSSSLDLAETLGEPGNQTPPQFSQCLRFICSECTQRLHRGSKPISCGHSPSHPIAPVSTNRMELEEAIIPMPSVDDYETSLIGLPSKVTSLVTQLKAQPATVKW